jgi:hypothetical protein
MRALMSPSGRMPFMTAKPTKRTTLLARYIRTLFFTPSIVKLWLSSNKPNLVSRLRPRRLRKSSSKSKRGSRGQVVGVANEDVDAVVMSAGVVAVEEEEVATLVATRATLMLMLETSLPSLRYPRKKDTSHSSKRRLIAPRIAFSLIVNM